MLVKTSTVAMLMAVASVSAKAKPQMTNAQVDFGFCVPTMKFEGGLGGRPADEFAFRAIDPVVAQDQNEAKNPNIITNHICEQLTDVCEANEAAKVLCRDAQAQIKALGTRDQTTADIWNDIITGGATPAVTPELKKRSENRPARRQIDFIPCSTEAWLDNCTGWPRKRGEAEEESVPVKQPVPVKREAKPANRNAKRQIPFIPCSAEAWIDTCTGWP